MRDTSIMLTCLAALASTAIAQQNSTLLDAKIAIQHIVDSNKQATGVNFAPKFLRLGFHDCVGGCDGCVVSASRSENTKVTSGGACTELLH